MKLTVVVAGTLLAMLVLVGCGKKDSTVPMSETVNSAAGIEWKAPAGWSSQGERTWRVATYTIPMIEQDTEAGECAVFFFGTGQGGELEDNIERWVTQFEGQPTVSRSATEINGLGVTRVEIAGNYLAPAGPMMQSQGVKEDFLLLGAIVEAPGGYVFFKSTGPRKTMEAAKPAFEALLSTLKKQ